MDVLVGLVGLGLVTACSLSSLPFRWVVAVIMLVIFAILLFRLDDEPIYLFVWHMIRYKAYPKRFYRVYDDKTLENFEASRKDTIDSFYGEKEEIKANPEDEREEKRRIRQLIKEEDKILKSKTATEEEKDAVWLARAERSAERKKKRAKEREQTASYEELTDFMPYTGIKDGFIEYDGKYYGAVIEIDPIEFRFFSEYRRNYTIESCFGKVLRGMTGSYGANIVKIQRPIIYDDYLDAEYDKLDALRSSYESGLLTEAELQARVEIQYDRINEIRRLSLEEKVIEPFYYLVMFESDRRRLDIAVRQAMIQLGQGELKVRRLDSKGLALFLKYNNTIDFDEKSIDDVAEE